MEGATRGVSDDDHARALDDTRNEVEHEELGADAQGVPVEAPGSGTPATAGERDHGGALPLDETKLVEDILLGIQRTEWAGPLPPPDMLYAYTPDDQRKIISWSDAMILDESKRSDKLVDAVIAATKREQWFSFLSVIAPVLAAFLAFVVTRDPISLSFLAVPGITIAVNVIGAVRGKDEPFDEQG